jgi:hypothetical protein
MSFRKRPSYSLRDFGILGLLGLIAVILGSVLIGINIALSRGNNGGGEFFVGYESSRAFLFEHTEPYGSTVASLTQELAYGRMANSGENTYFLTIPFFLLPLYFPFTLFTDSASARGLWMFISEAGLIGSAFIALRLIDWRPNRLFIVFFSLISIFNYYSITGLFEGTPVILLGCLYLGFLLAYFAGRDELAGALLVLTLFYWQVGSLFIILVILKIFTDKRWQVLLGFGMTFIILFALSLLIYPGWIFSFVVAMFASIRSQFGVTSAGIFTQLSPLYGHTITQGITILICLMLIYEWVAARHSDSRRFIWAACLTLAATPLIGFRTEMSNLVLIFPCLTLIFAAAANRWKTGLWLSTLLLTIVLLVPWAFYVRWSLLNESIYYVYLFLFYPVFAIVGLYWIRWWFVRPPRTWLDQVRSIN